MRVLAKYLNLYLGISFDKFEEIEDLIVKSYTDESHQPTESVFFFFYYYYCQCFQI